MFETLNRNFRESVRIFFFCVAKQALKLKSQRAVCELISLKKSGLKRRHGAGIYQY